MSAMKRQRPKPKAGKPAAVKRGHKKAILKASASRKHVAQGRAFERVTGLAGAAGYVAEVLRPRRKVRKNMDMDAEKLQAAKLYFGARSETEAVNAALDLAVVQSEVAASVDRMIEAGGLVDAFAD